MTKWQMTRLANKIICFIFSQPPASQISDAREHNTSLTIKPQIFGIFTIVLELLIEIKQYA